MSPIHIPLAAPELTEADVGAALEVLRSGRLSRGPELEGFEAALAEFAGVSHAVAVNSGTSGLHLALRALGIGEGHEVLTTPFSFVASANAILHAGARPVFVDIDGETLNLDPGRLEAAVTARTRAILVVHVFGRPATMEEILEVARRHGLRVVEDACEALGGEYRGHRLGGLGDAGVYAFYANKPVTGGEGGAVVTRHPEVARRVAALRNQGRDPADPDRYTDFGYSCRLTEVQCALGRSQLARIQAILERREAVARMYDRALRGRLDLRLPELEPEEGRRSWFTYVVRLPERLGGKHRDAIAAGLEARGIQCGRYFPPIHLLPPYRRAFGHRVGDFPVTEAAAARTLALPLFGGLTQEQVREVADALVELCVRPQDVPTPTSRGRGAPYE